jgi:DNA-binding NarL/FixJ family response regulator
VRSDFDDYHNRLFALCAGEVTVHANIVELNNGQQEHFKPKRHNAKLCPFAIRQRIVNALANGDSKRAIARALRVSNNTVTAIAEQDWQQVAAHKERIAAQCELNATLAAERMADKLQGTDNIPLNTLVPVFGVSVDKLAVLRVTLRA